MKKNIKAIIAALSASIMCAVPVAASFANTAAVTSITAEAAADIVSDATLLWDNLYITSDALTYKVENGKATLTGRYNPVSNVVMPDKINCNGTIYKITKVKANAFKNAHRTACAYGVTKFRCGKYVEEIGDYAFYNSSLHELDLHGASSLSVIGNDAFASASLEESIYIPGSVDVIRSGAFRDNRWIEFITIDGGVSLDPNVMSNNLRPINIGSRAFANLTSLVSFTVYRRYPQANGSSTNPDYSVFSGVASDFDPTYDIHGNVYGIPTFKHLFFRGF